MRVIVAVLVAVGLVALVTRAAPVRRLLFILLGLILLYLLLKLTGVIDAIQPSR